MPCQLLILVILASFLILLSPVASKKPKETFSVPRHSRNGHVRNGFQAKKKVFKKMGWRMPDPDTLGDKDFAMKHAHMRATTASIRANPEPFYSEYLSPFTIGGQNVMLDIDTGSADTWCFSTLQPDAQQRGHGVFDSSKSSTFSRMDGYTFSIRYGDGTGAEGVVGRDIMAAGPLSVQFPISLANNVTQEFVDDTNNDGLVGLGFSNINSSTISPGSTSFSCIFHQPLILTKYPARNSQAHAPTHLLRRGPRPTSPTDLHRQPTPRRLRYL